MSVADDRDIAWSSQLELLVAQEAERCRGLAWLNQRAESFYSEKNNWISIPVIVLSTLAGTASVGSTTLFPDDTKLGSIVIGCISLGVGILQSINSFYAYSKKAESHRVAYLHYNKLFNHIAVELSLPREDRASPDQILHELRSNMERLAETTPSPPQHILELFNKHFKDEDKSIARPVEVNGLQKIAIFRNPSHPVELNKILVQVEDVKATNSTLSSSGDGTKQTSE